MASKRQTNKDRQLSKPKISEADLERQCSDLLGFDGWRTLKTDPVSRREWGKGFGELGMADRLYIRYAPITVSSPGGVGPATTYSVRPDGCDVIWIEWKRPGGREKPHQTTWRMNEQRRGGYVVTAGLTFPATFEGFCAWYSKSGLLRRAGLCTTG